jgi:hypothetical protein
MKYVPGGLGVRLMGKRLGEKESRTCQGIAIWTSQECKLLASRRGYQFFRDISKF